jgi:dihydroflavonol-4-reductase
MKVGNHKNHNRRTTAVGVLVTGATGLVGNNVVRQLLETQERVRVLVREGSPPEPLQGLDIEIIHGDVCDEKAARRACEDMSVVIHAAARVHIGWSCLDLLRRVNVEGTRHVAAAAHEVGARLIHVSSVDTLGVGSWEEPANEKTPRVGKTPCSYVISKREAEQVVHEFIDDGLDAVITNPSLMFGPWDWKPSSGRMMVEVANTFTPLAPTGAISVCDVRDAAAGIISAVENGRAGNNYILAGHNITYFDLWKKIAKVSGGGAPIARLGPITGIIAGKAYDVWGKVIGKEPDINSASIAMSRLYNCYHSDKAVNELDYKIRPLDDILDDAWQWHSQRATGAIPTAQSLGT